MFSD